MTDELSGYDNMGLPAAYGALKRQINGWAD
jgi:hypothetical protein